MLVEQQLKRMATRPKFDIMNRVTSMEVSFFELMSSYWLECSTHLSYSYLTIVNTVISLYIVKIHGTQVYYFVKVKTETEKNV